MRSDKKNIIVEKSFQFSLKSIDFVEILERKKKYVVATQLLKSSTSIGANAREAQNAESKKDFIHKFKIAAKEADETAYWLAICEKSEHYPNPPLELKDALLSIIKIVSKIIASSKNNFQIN